MIDDARVVLEWLGHPHPECSTNQGDVFFWSDGSGVVEIDANWIMGKLVPALEERLGCGEIIFWPKTEDDEDHCVQLETANGRPDGFAPTFEAAFLAAAAAAIRGAK